jgi:hypothetical protein
MNAARRLRVGYMLADPGVDLSSREECCVHVERVVRSLREAGNEVSFVAVQSGDVVLTDTGFGLQQFFEAVSKRKPMARRPLVRPPCSRASCSVSRGRIASR